MVRVVRVYAGRSAVERRDDRRRRLVEAALSRFGAGSGYAGTTIEAICAAGGVTARHFYAEFGSREDLLLAVLSRVVDGAYDAVVDALSVAGDSPVERARAGLGAFVHFMLDDPRRARVLCLEVVGVSPRVEAARRAALRRFAALLTVEAVRFGLAPGGEQVALGALALVAGANELIVEALVGSPPPAVDEVVDELVRLFAAVGTAAVAPATW